MDKKILFLIVIHTMFSMENDNTHLIPKGLTPEIIKHACYFILHRHFENKECLRHAEPHCIGIQSQLCPAKDNPSLQIHFKEPQHILTFYNQDKQLLIENTLFFTREHTKEKLVKMAGEMLDPTVKPRAVYGVHLVGSTPMILNIFDKDNELLMSFLGFDKEIKLPLTQAQKSDLSRFVELADDFTIQAPEPTGCCNVI